MKLLFKYLLLSFVILLWQGCENDDLPGSIYGTVVDKATGEPIKSAGVELSPGGLKTVTGSEGQFEFTQLNPGSYTLLVTKTGYVDFATSMVNVLSNEAAKCDVQIEKSASALKVLNDNGEEIEVLDFGDSEDITSCSFIIFNDGSENLEWEIMSTTTPWIEAISDKNGNLAPKGKKMILVSINRSVLTEVENTSTLYITSNNGNKNITLKVLFNPWEADLGTGSWANGPARMVFYCSQYTLAGKSTTKNLRLKNNRYIEVPYNIYNIPKEGVLFSSHTGVIPARKEVSITVTFTYPSETSTRVGLAGCSIGTGTYLWNWEYIRSGILLYENGKYSIDDCCASCEQGIFVDVGGFVGGFGLAFNQYVPYF